MATFSPQIADDLGCGRGYELWLIQQAKVRNPELLTYGLSWGVPYWVGNGTYYSADNINYQTNWLKCIRNQTGGTSVDFLGSSPLPSVSIPPPSPLVL